MQKIKGLKKLIGLDPSPYVVLSLYLDVDGRKYPQREYIVGLKNLIREAETHLNRMAPEQQAQVRKDFHRLERYVSHEFVRGDNRFLAVFVCSPIGLFETFTGPFSIKSRLYVGRNPYVIPLLSVYGTEPDALVILVDRSRARLFLYNGGRLDELEYIEHDVPQQVRESGWQGYEERRIERHVDEHIQWHLKEVAQRVRQYGELYETDRVILGGPEDVRREFQRWLPASLKQRLGPEIEQHPERVRLQDLKSEVHRALRAYERQQQERIIDEIIEKQPRMGGIGVETVIDALNDGRVAILVFDPDLTVSGHRCPDCGYMATNMTLCPRCQTPMQAATDLLPDIIERATQQAADLIPLTGDTALVGRVKRIGALFRF